MNTRSGDREANLALNGGAPVRSSLLPYGRQTISDEDVAEVVKVLRSDWLTTGPKVAEFESAFAREVGAKEAVAVSNGTAALHTAMVGAGIKSGDEVIVPPLTFAATANAVLYCGARPVFADVDPDTLLLDPAAAAEKITSKTRAVVGVDYAGQPTDSAALTALASRHGLQFISDACHALGASENGRPVGSLANFSTFSLHPVKPITTGEGGMVTTDDEAAARHMRVFRSHGITSDHRQREREGGFFYEQVELGFNYRLTDIQCALGISQLGALASFTSRRQQIADRYDAALTNYELVSPLSRRVGATHAFHLYVVRLDLERLRVDRAAFFRALRAEGVGANVHYVPVHLHPYYRETLGTGPGLCPVAEDAWSRILTLPVFPSMTDADVDDVVAAVLKVAEAYRA